MRGKEPPADNVPESSWNPSTPPWLLWAASMSTELEEDPRNASSAKTLLSNWLTSPTACGVVLLSVIGALFVGDLMVLVDVSAAIARSRRLGKLDALRLKAWHDRHDVSYRKTFNIDFHHSNNTSASQCHWTAWQDRHTSLQNTYRNIIDFMKSSYSRYSNTSNPLCPSIVSDRWISFFASACKVLQIVESLGFSFCKDNKIQQTLC